MKINSIALRVLFFTVSIVIMILIFCMSAQNASESSSTSSGFLKAVFSVFVKDFDTFDIDKQNSMILPFMHFTRKAAHFCIYAALGFFANMFVLTFKGKVFIRSLISAGVCLLYAASDEIHQLYVPGRSGQLSDVLLDFCGSVTGIIAAIIILIIVLKIKLNKKPNLPEV